jgi:hypothetical protein
VIGDGLIDDKGEGGVWVTYQWSRYEEFQAKKIGRHIISAFVPHCPWSFSRRALSSSRRFLCENERILAIESRGLFQD